MEPFFERKPVRHPEAIWREIDSETLILKLDTGQVSVLNPVGGEIWALMDGNRSLGDIVRAIGETYAVACQQVEQDMRAFLEALLNRDMVCWGPLDKD
jgi:hypothetical protein